MRQIHRVLGLASAVGVAWASGLAGQVTDACPVGQVTMGTIGIGTLECENCRVGLEIRADSGIGRRQYDFRSEPVVRRIVVGGPAAGRLRGGDVITAIDGHLITTREGGSRYGALVPGAPVTLRVRRDGREVEVTLTPVGECVEADFPRSGPPAPPPAPEPTAVPRSDLPPPRPAPPSPPRPAAAPRPAPAPRPWPSTPVLGFSIRCTDCSLQRTRDAEQWIWSFSESPVVQGVEAGSPAQAAGLRPGDVLTHVDGYPLTQADGGRRFGALEAGDTVTIRYLRNTVARTATLVAREAPEPVPAARPRERPPVAPRGIYAEPMQPEITRFTGSLGDAVIQVTGGRVTVTRTDDEIVIRSSDITVTIRRSGAR